MKKSLFFVGALMIATSALAQNEQLYLFRNDKQFNFYDLKDVKSIDYTGTANGFSRMTISTEQGDENVTMSAIDSCVVRTKAIPDIYVSLTDYPDITDLLKPAGSTNRPFTRPRSEWMATECTTTFPSRQWSFAVAAIRPGHLPRPLTALRWARKPRFAEWPRRRLLP